MDQPHQSKNEPVSQFRVNFDPLELPFTCTLSGVPQKLATATVLDSGYVMVDPESRQAIFVVISNDEATVDFE